MSWRLFDLLFRDNISKARPGKAQTGQPDSPGFAPGIDQAYADLDAKLPDPSGGQGLVLDTLWEKLPRPPFTEEDAETLAERVYDFVWQQSAGGRFLENMRAA